VQRVLPFHLASRPHAEPLREATWPVLRAAPKAIVGRWPRADTSGESGPRRGGATTALALWRAFLAEKLARYGEDAKHPDREATSGLSPYLHFGHIAAHQMVSELLAAERWTPERLAPRAHGKRAGWWGVSPAAEAFLEQLVTWRELGFTTCRHLAGYDRYESLPAWARRTLEKHERDPRPYLYDQAALESARTHDPIWNAAQSQLVREGVMHNSLRMLWAKKILEWTSTPRQALEIALHLNNQYGLDGRDPNSYSGVFWAFGRYDRPWGPERPVFGTVRYMTSASMARKLRLAATVARFQP
jgi:deoxyribodipyrimidine photo-lyase